MFIVGHQKIIKFLEESIAKDNLAHSYLFAGGDHIGKRLVAKTFAASLVYQEKPCFKCLFKTEVLERFHPDIIEVKPLKEKIGINQIRELKGRLALTPFSKRYKIIIIEEAEKLTKEAANSFLKLLEETPKSSIIILITNDLRAILPTVRSRCQILRFSLPSLKETENYLQKEYELSPYEAKKFYSLSLGRPGLAIKYLKDENLLETVKKQALSFIKFLEKKEDIELELAFGIDVKVLSIWLQIVRDIIFAKLHLPGSCLVPGEKIIEISQKYSFSELVEKARNIKKTIFYLNYNVNSQLAVENLIINL